MSVVPLYLPHLGKDPRDGTITVGGFDILDSAVRDGRIDGGLLADTDDLGKTVVRHWQLCLVLISPGQRLLQRDRSFAGPCAAIEEVDRSVAVAWHHFDEPWEMAHVILGDIFGVVELIVVCEGLKQTMVQGEYAHR